MVLEAHDKLGIPFAPIAGISNVETLRVGPEARDGFARAQALQWNRLQQLETDQLFVAELGAQMEQRALVRDRVQHLVIIVPRQARELCKAQLADLDARQLQ